jgi:hypothetical protein
MTATATRAPGTYHHTLDDAFREFGMPVEVREEARAIIDRLPVAPTLFHIPPSQPYIACYARHITVMVAHIGKSYVGIREGVNHDSKTRLSNWNDRTPGTGWTRDAERTPQPCPTCWIIHPAGDCI